MKNLHIRQADERDIQAIEQMYRRRVEFNDLHGIHQWDLEDVSWETLSALYCVEDYYVGTIRDIIVSGLCIVDVDALYWPHAKKGDALYLHKLCVDPAYCGCGYADALITFFKQQGSIRGKQEVRLDVREQKHKLRKMYERHGFQLHSIIKVHDEYANALYTCTCENNYRSTIT